MKQTRMSLILRSVGVLLMVVSTLTYGAGVSAAGGSKATSSVQRLTDATSEADGSDGGDATSGDASGGTDGSGASGASGGSGTGGDASANGGGGAGADGSGGSASGGGTGGDGGNANDEALVMSANSAGETVRLSGCVNDDGFACADGSDVWGDCTGACAGDVSGDCTGERAGDVGGDCTGECAGDVGGDSTGQRVSGGDDIGTDGDGDHHGGHGMPHGDTSEVLGVTAPPETGTGIGGDAGLGWLIIAGGLLCLAGAAVAPRRRVA